MPTVHLGLKLGQPQEHSGLVVVEREGQQHTVRAIHRFPAGMDYTQIAKAVARALSAEAVQKKHPRLYIDITGLGQPIRDLVYRRIRDLGCSLIPVVCNSGDTLDRQARPWVVGKLYLLSQIKMLLQEGWLFLPETDEARQLVAEIKTFQPTMTMEESAFQIGTRDELATALGLAVCEKDPSELIADVKRRAELALKRSLPPTQDKPITADMLRPEQKKKVWWE